MRSALPCLLVLAACSPTGATPGVAARSDGILGGGADTTSATVFILDLRFDNGQSAICTAVLVTPRVLLTAAHCVEPALKGATSVTVKATNKADATMLRMSDMIDVSVISRHPGWNPGDAMSAHDLAALLLVSAPPGVTPTPVQRSSVSSGQQIRAVGYGTTSSSASDSAIRRAVALAVGAVDTNTFDFGAAGSTGICSGDSGGPSFFTSGGVERVVGIHSRTNSTSCGAGTDIRVDAHLPFIDAFIAANDPALCTADGRCVASGCMTPDPDCPTNCGADATCNLACMTPDPDCCAANGRCDTSCPAGVRDPDCVCSQDGTCEASCPMGVTDPDCLCRADGRCESACPTGVTDPDCGCGADDVCVQRCAADPDCVNCAMNGVCSAAACPTPDPDCHLDGEPCTGPTDCVGRQCLADARGFKFCSRACTSSAVCQLDMVCSGGVCRAPVPAEMGGVTGGCASAPGSLSLALALLVLAGRRR